MNIVQERLDAKEEEAGIVFSMAAEGTPITCGSNCSACCHAKVDSFPIEVADIISRIDINNIDMVKLQAQVDDWDTADHNCVFLDGSNCSLHDLGAKPLACTRHLTACSSSGCAEGVEQSANHLIKLSRASNLNFKNLRREDGGGVHLHTELHKLLTA